MASISITAPSSAEEGKRVSVSVRVTSTLAYHASYKATIYAVPDLYPDYVIGSIDQVILSGSSVTRSASFTMPDCNTTVFVWVERWSKDHWVYDGSASKVVTVEIPVPTTFHLSILVPSWAAGGYVDPGSGDYPANTTVKLTAHPLSGYQFTGWGRDASGTSPTYNLYMSSDKNVEAYFEKIPVPETFHLSVSVPSGGYVTPSSGDYPANTTITLRAYPYSGYQFVRWGGDASGTSTTFNLYMNSDKNVEAFFEKVPVPVEGTIIRKELEFSGSGDGIVPVADVPLGVSAKLHVWGRNDMATDQKLGIYWFVADPDGEIAEEYEDWQSWPFPTTPPGETHEFISSGQFDLNKVGKYTTWIELLMGTEDDPEIVDRYIGDLCTVVSVVPEYKGKISKKELEYDETRGIIPVY